MTPHDTTPSADEPAPRRIDAHASEVGGIRLRRALPSRTLRTVGAWCFLDHVGPAQLPPGQGMHVGPHPHIGLQTFTWMIEGELLHRDSLGSEQVVRAGQVNLMTAGRGIVHSEDQLTAGAALHAVLVLRGSARVAGEALQPGTLLDLGCGRTNVPLHLASGCQVLVLGGAPFGAPPLLWWNFVARAQGELEQALADWNRGDARFGPVPDAGQPRLTAPSLAGVRLKTRSVSAP